MSSDTAAVTRPRTGLAFFDAGLEQPGAVLAFAHRGGAFHPELEGLENTAAAVRHAVALGYSYLETDVHATSDGQLLAFHDAVLDRVTERTGAVADLRYAEVADALIGGHEQIPRLSDLFEEFPQARFNIDLKSAAAIAPLVDLIARHGAWDRVCVASFSERRLAGFRRRSPREVATALGPIGVVGHALPSDRLSRRLAGGAGRALQVPAGRGGVRLVTRRFVERAHRLGRPVHVWTVDDPAEMHDLLDLGVDGLMTDRTDLLREVLLDRGQWMGAPR
jgi:glycerophosphoryl diester phosphodiesterase